MGAVWYRTRSDLRARWTGAVGVALIVAAVGAVVLTLTAGVTRTLTTADRYTAALGDLPDAALEQAGGRPRTAEVAALPAVAEVHNATFVFAGFLDGETPVEGFVFAGDVRAFGARLIEGREPDPRAPGEFVATPSWLEVAGADLGDVFELVTITAAQAAERGFDAPASDGPTMPATLVGVVGGPNQLQDPTPLTLFPSSLLDVGDVGVAASVGIVRLTEGSTLEELRAQLDALPDGQDFGLGSAEWVPPEVARAVRTQGQALAVVAAIVAVAGVAVLGQLLSRRSRQEPAERRALTAMGWTRTQAALDPLGAAVVPAIAGSVGAAGLAIAASGLLPAGLARQVEPDPGLRVDPLVHLAGPGLLAALLLAWVLAALVSTRQPSSRDELTRPSRVEALASRLRAGPAATGLRFALGRHPRDGGAQRAPVAGLVLVLAVLVGALTFGSSVERFLDEPARYGSNFDFATGAGGDAVPVEVRNLLVTHPDVRDVTLFGTIFASVGTEALDVTGMEPVRGDLEPDLLAGRLPLRADELAIGRATARALDLDVDDIVDVQGAAGPSTYLVTGSAIVPGVDGGDGIGRGGLVTADGLRRLDPEAQMSVAAARLRPGADGALAEIEHELGLALGLPSPSSEVLNIDRVRSTPFLVAGALALLVTLSFAHQLLTSARRRRRDLAILRVLGAGGGWVTGALHWQVTVLAAAVAAVAVPLGVGGARLVYEPFIDRLGARTDLSVPYAWVALAVAGAVLIGNAMALVPARRTRLTRVASLLGPD